MSNPKLFGPNTDGLYGMPSISSVAPDILKRVLLTSLVVRTTGRVEALRAYLEYTQQGRGEHNWKRLFEASDCHNLPFYIASCSGNRDSRTAFNLKESMISWLTDQYKTNLPEAVLTSPKSFGLFLQRAAAAFDEFVTYMSEGICAGQGREDVVRRLCGVLQTASQGTNEKVSSLMFIAHQIVADLEELVSKDGERGASPFFGDFCWPGYGGKEGFTAMDHKQILGRVCSGPGYKVWNIKTSPGYFVELWTTLKLEMENGLHKLMLAMLGVEKVDGCIRVCLTGRSISLSDFEHLMCKVYMGCMRSRGTRSGGAPKPWRNYCWPSKSEETVGNHVFEDVICSTIVRAYEQALKETSQEADGELLSCVLPVLEHPFSDI
jgi:hypothetical protein